LVIAADVRLDNRAELCAALAEPDTGQPDAALILAAYARWGEACAERLLGDFAFALWDTSEQSLFCARDYFGVRPFFYYHSPSLFAFASNLPALLQLPLVPRRISEQRVAGYLIRRLDHDLTFYHDVQRLEAAHTLTISARGKRQHQFWNLENLPATRLPSDEAYAEGLRAVLTDAVRGRIRSSSGAGILLSGGLDSSSLTCLARPMLVGGGLHTFSALYDESRASDERDYIAEVTALGGLEPHAVSGDGLSPLSRIDTLIDLFGEPFYHTALAIQWRLNEAARAAGVRALLDGNYGDSVVSYGTLRVAELLRAGRVLAAAREVVGMTRGMSSRGRIVGRLFWHFGLHPLVPEPLRRLRHAWLDRQVTDRPKWARGTFIHPDFARRLEAGLGLSHGQREPPPIRRREQDVLQFEVGRARTRPELYNQLAAISQVESSHPFLDRRVVEFCMGLPSEQRMTGGVTRIIMRRAMRGLLPEKIRQRRFKVIPFASLGRALLTRDLAELGERLRAANLLGEWVDLPAVERMHAGLVQAAAAGDYERPRHRETMRELGRVLALAVWAQHEQARGRAA
jgi:asparagine synthase (glutamine-hydrolysing)